MRGLVKQWVLGVLVAGWAAEAVLAGVTVTGNTEDDGTTFYAGYVPGSTGGLAIDAGSVFDRRGGYLGFAARSTGTAIISGTGSTWTSSDALSVGWQGSGKLRVEAGGQVNSSAINYLGYNSGSTGEAVVTGAGSKWTNSSYLCVGYYLGSGMLTVSDGGLVSAKTLYASLGDLYGNGSIAVQSGVVLDADLSFDASRGLAQTLAFGSGGTLQFTIDGTSDLGVGYKHSGSLRIAEGRVVTSVSGGLGYFDGSTGTAKVTGAGSKWANTEWLVVGANGRGSLSVSDGAQVTARNLGIYDSQSTVRLHVSGDRMLVLGNASTVGSVSNYGTVSFMADAFLPAGTYRPVSEYADRTVSWSDTGSTSAVGGDWDNSAKTFTVVAPTVVDAGVAAVVGSGQRLLIGGAAGGGLIGEAVGEYAHPTGSGRLGVSFGVVTTGTSLTASLLGSSESAGLMPLLGAGETMLGGWDFAGQLAGDEALVSFEVGLGANDVRVWRFSQSGWSAYAPQMMTYDSHGIVSFTIDPASLNGVGYAVSGVVPEPGAIGVLAMAACGLLVRRRAARSARRVWMRSARVERFCARRADPTPSRVRVGWGMILS